MFIKAERRQSRLRLALIGPSGSGKTYSGLIIAQGLGGKIAMIDTETGSGSLYADLCDYAVAELKPPFSPEKYIEAIHAAEKAGYQVLIIDSLSHAWAGQGGLLEYVDKATQSLKNNFAAWREASPKHNALVDAMLQSSCHIIGTMRSKTAWEVQKDERSGKTKPVKVGLAPVQRDGLEYEFTSVLELSVDGHVATSSKDRTGLFDNQYFVPGNETGQALKTWLEGGQEPPQNDVNTGFETTHKPGITKLDPIFQDGQQGDAHTSLMSKVYDQLRQLGLASNLSGYEKYVQGKYRKGMKDLGIEELSEQIALLHQCANSPEMCQKFAAHLVNGG